MRFIDPDGKDWKDFLRGVKDGFIERFQDIGHAIAHPIETVKNIISRERTIVDVAIMAGDICYGGTVSYNIEFFDALYSDIDGGNGSATGKFAGRQIADITVVVTAKAGGKVARGAAKAAKAANVVDEAASAAKTGTTVLGKYPDYINLAGELGAKRFNIPISVWNKMTSSEQWAANVKFLDRMITRGDKIVLSNRVIDINKVTGAFRQELDYLISKGYKLSSDGL